MMFPSLVSLVVIVIAAPAPASPSGAKRPVEVQGHRGARAVLPENTIAAFKHALAAKADVLELDLHVTSDDVLVVAHDPRVPDWCNARNGEAIRTMTAREVQALDCGGTTNRRFPAQRAAPGEKIPTLAEVLALDENARFNIEAKSVPGEPELSVPPARWAELVVDALDKAIDGRARVTVQSFDHRVLLEVRKRAKNVKTVALIDESLPADLVLTARAAKADIVSPNYKWITKDDVIRLHKAKIRVVVWTVNEQTEWQRMIDLGVDGIITDDPKALVTWLETVAAP